MTDTDRNNPPEKKPHKTFITDGVTFCPALKSLESKDHILKNINALHITGSGFVLKAGYPEGVEITIQQSPMFDTAICVTITSEQVTLSPIFFERES